MYVYSYCNALSVRFFAVDRALNAYIMIMIMDAPVVTFICQTQSSNVFLLYLIFVIILFSYHYSRGISWRHIYFSDFFSFLRTVDIFSFLLPYLVIEDAQLCVVGGSVWLSVRNYRLLLYWDDYQPALAGAIEPALGSRLVIRSHHLALRGRSSAYDWQLCTSHWLRFRLDARLCADAVRDGGRATQASQTGRSHRLSSTDGCLDGHSVYSVLRRTHLHLSRLPVF